MESQNKTGTKLIFACSGAADVGEISDRAARQLSREGVGKMYCLSGIGAGLNNFIDNSKSAAKILVIDGCEVDCAKKTVEKAGIDSFDYIRITDLGFQKGNSPASEESIETIAQQGREYLIN